MGVFNILTLNFSRYKNEKKILQVWEKLSKYEVDIYCLQEVNIESVLKCFNDKYQVIVNWEDLSNNKIGIAMLVKNNLKNFVKILGGNGRSIGIKLENMQVWNLYPQSGSLFKKDREIFFTEKLCNYMMLWKDQTKFLFQLHSQKRGFT